MTTRPQHVLAAISALVLLGYVAGTWMSALALDAPWSTVALHEANRADHFLMRGLVQPLTWICGTLLVTFIPGLPWAALRSRTEDLFPFLATALAISVGAQIVIGTVLKFWAPLTRPVYVLALLAITGVGWLVAAVGARQVHVPVVSRADARRFAGAAAAVAAIVVIFWGRLIHEAFNGDGLEAFELARSLVQYALPRWDVEVGSISRFGFHLTHPPLLAYLHLPPLLLFGFTEASVRGVFVFAWLLTILTAWVVIDTGSPAMPARVRVLAMLGLLPLVLNAFFYSGTDDFSELAKCGEVVLLALVLCSFALLQRHHPVLGVVFAVMASSIRWYGAVIMIAAFALLALSDRRHRRALTGLVAVLCVIGATALITGIVRGDIAAWMAQGRYEFLDLMRGVPGYRAAPVAIGWHFLLFSGLLAPVVAFAPWQDATTRVLSALTVVVLGFVSSSSLVANHFLTVAAYLPTLVACRMLTRSATHGRRSHFGWAVAMGAVATASVILTPTATPVHDATRVIGRQTCIDASSYESAVVAARAAGIISTDARFLIGPHALAHYGRRMSAPAGDCTYFISPQAAWAPASAILLGDTNGYRIWADVERRARILAMEIPVKDTYYRLPSLRAVIVER